MAYEQRDLSGAIFKNEKRTTDNHPQLTGKALIDGVEYWVSGWTKKDKNSDTWVSLSFKKKEPRAAESTTGGWDDKKSTASNLGDDDIPF